jgi:hypothetical protein
MANGRCRNHGGLNPGAPPGHINSLLHGRRTAEAEIERKAGAAMSKAIRAMIRSTVAWAIEGRMSPEEGHAQHAALMAEFATQEANQREARARNREKLDRHYQRLEGETTQGQRADKPAPGKRRRRAKG